MKINQDTFKNGVLFYGAYETPQRDTLYEWRWQQFIDIITVDYPEYFLKFYSHRKVRQHHLKQFSKKINFKMRDKLMLSLEYSSMESVNSAEFEKVLKKFVNCLVYDKTVGKALKTALTQPLPLTSEFLLSQGFIGLTYSM